MKKAIVLVVAILLVLMAIPAFADNEHKSGLFTYELKKNGTAIITDYDWDNSEGGVYVPGTIDGYTVVEIGESAFSCEFGSSGLFHSNVSVTLPESIVSIDDFAFSYTGIRSINIPRNVENIGKGVFSSWQGFINTYGTILQFRIDSNHPHFAVIDNALYNKDRKELLYFSYEYELSIPEGIISIGDYSLCGAKLGKISLPSTLTNIGEYAFASINGWTGENDIYVSIPHSVTTIGAYAFVGIDSVFLGSTSVTSLPDGVFKNVRVIKISNPQSIQSLGKETYFGNIITSPQQLSSKITNIPTGFGYNRELKSLPDTVITIDSKAFTSKVEDFKLSPYLIHIEEDAFPTGSTFIVESGSYAERWASENGFAYTVEGQDNLDWLYN